MSLLSCFSTCSFLVKTYWLVKTTLQKIKSFLTISNKFNLHLFDGLFFKVFINNELLSIMITFNSLNYQDKKKKTLLKLFSPKPNIALIVCVCNLHKRSAEQTLSELFLWHTEQCNYTEGFSFYTFTVWAAFVSHAYNIEPWLNWVQ